MWLSESVYTEKEVMLLRGFEYLTNGRHREGTPQIYRSVTKDMDQATSMRAKLKALPPSHFVWSDDLVQAFTRYIDLFIGREDAAADGMGLKWNVSLSPFEALFGECPDFAPAGSGRQAARKLRTKAKHARLQAEVSNLAKKRPGMSHSWICKRLSQLLKEKGETVNPDTIRRNTRLKS